MGYDDKPQLNDEYDAPDPRAAIKVTASIALTALVRGLGLVLIFAGLWAILNVVVDAVGLYNHPERIEPMVTSIENTAGLGHLSSAPPTDASTPTINEGTAAADATDLRPAYFFAWLIVFMLFLVIGKLADWLITKGLSLASFRCYPRNTGH